MNSFAHLAPSIHHYEYTDFKANVFAIWIVNDRHFDYCGRSGVKSIWGFYNTKTKQFHSPINAKTIGKVVDINKTTPYSAMQLL
jgi:hypothetical protein